MKEQTKERRRARWAGRGGLAESEATGGTSSGAHHTKPRGQRQGQEQTAAAGSAPNERVIPYDEAVKQGLALKKQKNDVERCVLLGYGELIAHIDKKAYGDRTVAKFGKAIGLSVCTSTLHRYAAVYRAWDGMGIVAPGPTSYAVLRALQNHPAREEIVKEDPKISKRDAEKLRDEHEGKQKDKDKSGDWKRKEMKRWLCQVLDQANDFIRNAVVPQDDKEAERILREIVEPKLLAPLPEASAALTSLFAYLKQLAEQLDVAA